MKQIWSLDTEDDSKGKVHLVTFDSGKFHTFRNPSDAIEFLSRETSPVEIWATNLAYDLTNLFRSHFNCLEITYIKGRVIQAKIKGTQITFKDTLNHWKISVKEMGKRIGLEKIETDDFNNIEYNQRDARITRLFVLSMKEKYESFGAKLKSTIGSTALDLFYSRYHPKPKHSFFRDRDIDWMLGGYYGGRTEIFHTEPVRDEIHYFDFNSLYPSCMYQRDFPTVNRYGFRLGFNEAAEGIAEARVFVPRHTSIPYLPVRSERGLIFPTGRFRGRWTHFELREAQKHGVKIEKAYRSIEFSGTSRPFDNFVKDLYEKRLAAQSEKDQLMSDSTKLILNNLYGKFAQGNEITYLKPFDPKTLKQGDKIYGNLIIRDEVRNYPAHTNVVWSAYVTAYGRDALHSALSKVEESGSRLIYCDTDSIIFSGRSPFKSSNELGALKSEGSFNYAHFKLPKLYRLDGEKKFYKAKGVPKNFAEDFFEKGFAEFKRPNKLRESLRRKLVPNEWHLTRKEMRREYDKRYKNRDGSTEPLEVHFSKIKRRNAKAFDRGAKAKDQPDNRIYRKSVRTVGFSQSKGAQD